MIKEGETRNNYPRKIKFSKSLLQSNKRVEKRPFLKNSSFPRVVFDVSKVAKRRLRRLFFVDRFPSHVLDFDIEHCRAF